MLEKYFPLARQLQKASVSPADVYDKKDIRREHAFMLAYSYYLLTIDNESTREQYRSIIDHFARFTANVRNITPLDALGIDISLWREDLIRTGGVAGAPSGKTLVRYEPNGKASVHKKVSVLSAFYKFLQTPGLDGTPPLVTYNPVDALHKRFKIEKYGRSKKISLETLKKIIKEIDLRSLKGLRDYSLIYGFFITGRRNREWLRLQWSQINFNTDPVTFKCIRKGQKDTIDELPDELLKVLITYLSKRWGEDFLDTIDGETYLFTAMPGRGGSRQIIEPNNPLTERSMLRILKGYAKAAGLDETTITVHSIRHLHAQSYLEAGADVEEIRARMGHAGLATTQRYLSSFESGKNRLAGKLHQMLSGEQSETDRAQADQSP